MIDNCEGFHEVVYVYCVCCVCRFFGNRSYCHERLGQFDK